MTHCRWGNIRSSRRWALDAILHAEIPRADASDAGRVRTALGRLLTRLLDCSNDDLRVRGAAITYRFHDIGYAIDLEHVTRLLISEAPARARPGRIEARALQIANPPVAVSVGMREIDIEGVISNAQLSARIFDFGVVSLRLEMAGTDTMTWSAFVHFARMLEASSALDPVFARELEALRERIAPAVERAGVAPVHEEYTVYRIAELGLRDGRALDANAVLSNERLAPLLLNEQRALAVTALGELLQHRLSYYADDLVVLTWENALVLEPSSDDRDVEYILEFANAQLLELRVYDAVLDAELPVMYDQVSEARHRRHPLPTRRFQGVLSRLQTRVADVIEMTERAENALKVTDDVYLARVYGAALELFRATSWRRGIERKLEIVRSTYVMLNGEAQAARSELLEIAVVLLIVTELVLGIIRH